MLCHSQKYKNSGNVSIEQFVVAEVKIKIMAIRKSEQAAKNRPIQKSLWKDSANELHKRRKRSQQPTKRDINNSHDLFLVKHEKWIYKEIFRMIKSMSALQLS